MNFAVASSLISIIVFIIFTVAFVLIFRAIVKRVKNGSHIFKTITEEIKENKVVTLVSEKTQKICEYCGTKLDKEDKKCPNCGAKNQ